MRNCHKQAWAQTASFDRNSTVIYCGKKPEISEIIPPVIKINIISLPNMRCYILAALTLLLQLQISSAAPVHEDQALSTRDTPLAKRCMTDSEIANIQAHWPKNGGIGPALIRCPTTSKGDSDGNITNPAGTIGSIQGSVALRSVEIEELAKRYLADKRSMQGTTSGEGGVERRCMTEDQISAFQAAWPKAAGLGPALVSCPT